MDNIRLIIKNIEGYETSHEFDDNPNYGSTIYEVESNAVVIDRICHEFNEYNNPVMFDWCEEQSANHLQNLEFTGEYKNKTIQWNNKVVQVGFILSEGKVKFLAYSFNGIEDYSILFSEECNSSSEQEELANYLEYLYS